MTRRDRDLRRDEAAPHGGFGLAEMKRDPANAGSRFSIQRTVDRSGPCSVASSASRESRHAEEGGRTGGRHRLDVEDVVDPVQARGLEELDPEGRGLVELGRVRIGERRGAEIDGGRLFATHGVVERLGATFHHPFGAQCDAVRGEGTAAGAESDVEVLDVGRATARQHHRGRLDAAEEAPAIRSRPVDGHLEHAFTEVVHRRGDLERRRVLDDEVEEGGGAGVGEGLNPGKVVAPNPYRLRLAKSGIPVSGSTQPVATPALKVSAANVGVPKPAAAMAMEANARRMGILLLGGTCCGGNGVAPTSGALPEGRD
ncbi:MAG: hypothetical protein CBB77_08755 [Hyphomonas sp. TMED17]|nr:MAG: hypothetical protein CBB77_08755 [Hyphomonas sp. TMED17]